jgi:hypothetical protein
VETSFTYYQEIIPGPLILYLSLLRTVGSRTDNALAWRDGFGSASCK